MSAKQDAYRAHILKALDLFHEPGSVFEICVIGPKKQQSQFWEGKAFGKDPIIAGWFDDHQKAAELAFCVDSIGAAAIYFTPNPCTPALLSRCNNRLQANVDRTTDNDIMALNWLLIDVDPKRPKGTSSSNEEHAFSLEHAKTIRAALMARGWPEPIHADSGNGAHLTFRLPGLKNTQENRAKLKAVLAALNGYHQVVRNGITLNVDTSVFNPARLCKLYGTCTLKGDSMPARPHRRSQILTIPKEEP
jgi:hypothetical protein